MINPKLEKIYSLIETVSPFAEVRQCSTTKSKSVHATVNLRKNQIISRFEAKEVLDKPNYLTLQINRFQHIMLNPEWLQYINHGCDPNLFFDVDNLVLVTLNDIEINQELRFFYPSTEWSMDNIFNCFCHSESCLGQIKGAKFLPVDVLKKYQLSQHLSQRLKDLNNNKIS